MCDTGVRAAGIVRTVCERAAMVVAVDALRTNMYQRQLAFHPDMMVSSATSHMIVGNKITRSAWFIPGEGCFPV